MLLPPVSSFPTPGKPAQLLSWSQERLQSRHTTWQIQVLEAGQAMALSPAAVIVPASLALFTQSKKVVLGILKDSCLDSFGLHTILEHREGGGRVRPLPGRNPQHCGRGRGLGPILFLLQRLQVLAAGGQQAQAAVRHVAPPGGLQLRRDHPDPDQPHLGGQDPAVSSALGVRI